MITEGQEALMERILAELAQGRRRFEEIDNKLNTLIEVTDDIPHMKKSIDETKDIVEAWRVVKANGTFLKWIAGILLAIGSIYAIGKAAVAEAFSFYFPRG